MSATMPVYCGNVRGNTACLELAVAAIDSHGRHIVACPAHRGAAERWAATTGPVTITAVVQPHDAIAGDGQATLFDFADGGL